MKKTLLLLSVFILTSALLFGGGIITNTNQSASYVRLPARDASTEIDATYFNPAGLSLLPKNGFFLSLSNQTLEQTKTVISDYQYLNNTKYIGNVSAPFFPGIYAGFKTDKFVISGGFNPIGGGGGAKYDDGLPSFEYDISDLVPSLASQGVTAYRFDRFFEGTSVFFGYQLNFTYNINDMLSVALGGRLVTAKETYNGYLRDIEVNYNGTWTRADYILNGLASQATSGAALASGAAAGMQPLIDGGAGSMTFQQAQDAFLIDALTRGQLEGGLTALGIDPTGLTLAQAQAAYQGAAVTLTEQATEASMNARLLGDKEADAEKTGMGFTPIISVNFKPSEKLNIALKYEHNTKLELKNKTNKDITLAYIGTTDSVTMFPDGAKARLDVPSMISLGATYRPVDRLMISAGAHYFLEKNADWAGREDSLKGDFLELSLGLEYNITEKIKVSGGYVYAKSGAGPAYQTDMSYSLTSHSFGFGGAYRINDMLELNLGGLIAVYQDGEREPYHELATIPLPITETLDKSTWIVSVGLDFYFGK